MNKNPYELTVGDFIASIIKDKWLVLFVTTTFSIVFIALALYLPNKYKSDILLMPVTEQESNLAGLSSQLGGLASIAGINLGGQSDKTDLAIATLKSRTFLMEFIADTNIKVELLAVRKWDVVTGSYTYDEDVYDPNSKQWIRDVSPPKQAEPSQLEAYVYFLENLLEVEEDKETGFVRVAIKHISPVFAEETVKELIQRLDNKLRQDAEIEAEKSIEYLQGAILKAKNADLKSLLYTLVEQEFQKKMLTEVRETYAFKVIDNAVVAEDKYSPKRALICIFGFILGVCFSLFIVFIKALKNPKEQE